MKITNEEFKRQIAGKTATSMNAAEYIIKSMQRVIEGNLVGDQKTASYTCDYQNHLAFMSDTDGNKPMLVTRKIICPICLKTLKQQYEANKVEESYESFLSAALLAQELSKN